MGKRELAALLSLSSWCLVIVVWFFLAVSWFCLQFVIVIIPDHTYLLSLTMILVWPYDALLKILPTSVCLLLPCGHLLKKG